MARVILPQMRPIPDGATRDDRVRMYEEYRLNMARLNPHLMNPDGTNKSFWQRFKCIFSI